jgi:FkbM family methyltransferase
MKWKMIMGGMLDRLHRRAARWAPMVRLAGKLKNQAEAVLGYAACPHPADPERDGELVFLESLRGEIHTFLDVGANIGEWSESVLAVAPEARGLLFEPNPEAAAEIPKRTRVGAHIEVIEAAVSDRPGAADLFFEGDCGKRSSLARGANPCVDGVRRVPVVTLDEAVMARGTVWKTIDLLKIDTEGFDLHVLRGAAGLLARKAVRFIQFEYNSSWAHSGATLGAAIALLEGHGYEMRLLQPGGPIPFDYGLYREFFRYANFLAAPAVEWAKPSN